MGGLNFVSAGTLKVGLLCTAMALVGLAAVPVRAVEPDEILKDPGLEARARVISAELRCLVCQNQSIDDSNAPLARDLRLLVRERLKEGDSNDQTMKFIVARYGEFVLLRPTYGLHNMLLWLTPLLGLLGGGFLALRYIKRGERAGTSSKAEALTVKEQARLDALLKEHDV